MGKCAYVSAFTYFILLDWPIIYFWMMFDCFDKGRQHPNFSMVKIKSGLILSHLILSYF